MQKKFRKKIQIRNRRREEEKESQRDGERERERKGRASIKRSCNTRPTRVPRQQTPASTVTENPPPPKAQKQKTKKKKRKKNLFGTTESITKNGNRQHSGAPLAFFFS